MLTLHTSLKKYENNNLQKNNAAVQVIFQAKCVQRTNEIINRNKMQQTVLF